MLVGEQPARQDVVLRPRAAADGRNLQRISECHRAYEPLHFVLLFPLGTDGWHPQLQQQPPVRKLTSLQYSAYRLQTREAEDDSLMRAGRLLQEYCCMAFARVETQRLVWAANNQRQLRADLYQHLVDAMAGDRGNAADNQPAEARAGGDAAAAAAGQAVPHGVGRRIILPPSFIGGPRDMMCR